MPTVAIVHIGLAGHVGPATRLGAVLARHGHRVVAWGPESYRAQIESEQIEFRAHEPAPVSRIAGGLAGFAALLADGVEREVGGLIEGLLQDEVELVIHDYHAVWGRVGADFLGLPRIVSNPLFPRHPDNGASPNGDKDEPRARSPMFPRGWQDAARRAEASRLAIVRKWGIDIGDWSTIIESPGDRTISYTTADIVGEVAKADYCYVGPLLAPPAPYEPKDPPLVYVAFGTFTTYNPDAYRAVIDALADERVQVLVSTGRGNVSPGDLEPLPSNVTVEEFVDSRAVLARASAHVTHGGGGSVHESLLAGVPMVCIPQGVDQGLWAERVASLGAGELVELDPPAIRAGVDRLLEDRRPRQRAYELGQQLAQYDGETRVVDLVDETLVRASSA